jgi:hypothetical protein
MSTDERKSTRLPVTPAGTAPLFLVTEAGHSSEVFLDDESAGGFGMYLATFLPLNVGDTVTLVRPLSRHIGTVANTSLEDNKQRVGIRRVRDELLSDEEEKPEVKPFLERIEGTSLTTASLFGVVGLAIFLSVGYFVFELIVDYAESQNEVVAAELPDSGRSTAAPQVAAIKPKGVAKKAKKIIRKAAVRSMPIARSSSGKGGTAATSNSNWGSWSQIRESLGISPDQLSSLEKSINEALGGRGNGSTNDLDEDSFREQLREAILKSPDLLKNVLSEEQQQKMRDSLFGAQAERETQKTEPEKTLDNSAPK